MGAELALADDRLTVEFEGNDERPDLTPAEAEAVTGRIRRWVNDFPTEDVVLAFRGRVWIALAYDSWSEWCECELGGLKLPAPRRREVVSGLAEAGLSNVAIGDAVGVNEITVRRDLAGSTNVEPSRERLGQDGKSYNPPQPKPGVPEPETVDAEIVCKDCDGYGCETCFPAAGPVSDVVESLADGDADLADKLSQSLNGSRLEPEVQQEPRPRRRPLEEGFFDATMRLNKAVTSLENLGKDERLPRNKNQVARYRNDLIRAIDALQRVAEQLA